MVSIVQKKAAAPRKNCIINQSAIIELINIRASNSCKGYFTTGLPPPVVVQSDSNNVCRLCELSNAGFKIDLTTTSKCQCVQKCCGLITSNCCEGKNWQFCACAKNNRIDLHFCHVFYCRVFIVVDCFMKFFHAVDH